MAQQEPFNFDIVFGFTGSIFVKTNDKSYEKPDVEQINLFIDHCKTELGITLETKNIFVKFNILR